MLAFALTPFSNSFVFEVRLAIHFHCRREFFLFLLFAEAVEKSGGLPLADIVLLRFTGLAWVSLSRKSTPRRLLYILRTAAVLTPGETPMTTDMVPGKESLVIRIVASFGGTKPGSTVSSTLSFKVLSFSYGTAITSGFQVKTVHVGRVRKRRR